MQLTEIALIPGYAKVDPFDGTDRFFENRRVLAAHAVFDDGSSVPMTFRESPTLQPTPVDAVTTRVVIVIDQTSAHGGRDFTAVSEVTFQGRQAP